MRSHDGCDTSRPLSAILANGCGGWVCEFLFGRFSWRRVKRIPKWGRGFRLPSAVIRRLSGGEKPAVGIAANNPGDTNSRGGRFIGGYFDTGNRELNEALLPISAGGLLFIGPLLMIVFRKKYPRWWFDWNLELSRFTLRVSAFLLVLRDEYPSTDEEQSAHLQIEYPNAETDLNRILPIFKWLLAIPHYIILAVLWILVIPATIRAWLLILVTGGIPKEYSISWLACCGGAIASARTPSC